jgi:hydrogenase maturation protease
VVERVAVAGPEHVIDAGTTPENFIGPLIQRAPQVILFVDAIAFGKPPGYFALATVDELADRLSTTHAPSLRLVADILAAYGVESWVLGIQPARTTLGAGLDARVERAAGEAAETLAWLLCREVSRV